jgi:hypothetical protein
MEKNIRGFLRGFLASTGHRGRVDARGQRGHSPAGLTRTSGPMPALLVVSDERDAFGVVGLEQRCATGPRRSDTSRRSSRRCFARIPVAAERRFE